MKTPSLVRTTCSACALAALLCAGSAFAQPPHVAMSGSFLNDSQVAGAAYRHGPYATMRRAQEVANQLRAQGWRTVAFHDGNGYWVDARR